MRAIVLGSVAALCLISVGGEIAAQDAATGCLQKNGKLDQVALGENPRGGACKGKSSQVKLQILSPGKTVHRVGEHFSTEQWMTTPETGELEEVFVELARIGGFTLSVHLWRSVIT